MIRFVLGVFLTLCFAFGASAEEVIERFDVTIDVQADGGLIVTEKIRVQSEGNQIKRGIFRELPRYYDFMGVRLENDYKFLSVKRDGERENFNANMNDNAVNVRIGNASVLLPNGPHTYEIRYSIPEQIRRHREDGGEDRDELYWNATGSYWLFPIERAKVTINFPNGADVIDTNAFTGRFQSRGGENYRVLRRGNPVVFETTQRLNRQEGITVSASIAPGVIAPMSAARKREMSWIKRGGPVLLGMGGLGLLLYYMTMWGRHGRDPVKQPVFPRYAPPKGYSSAAVHHIKNKGLRGMDALTSTLMALSTKDVLDIHAEKKKTTITSMLANRDTAGLLKDERKLLDLFFGDKDGEIIMDKKSDPEFFRNVTAFKRYIMKNYGKDYHRANAGWGLLGMAISVVVVMYVMGQPVSKSSPIFALILLAIAAMNILFFILLRAPTKKGAKVSAEIDGFKLYLETAETARINTANPLGEKPPAMTVDLYERFMPYAVALGVEKPWTKQFERTLPELAKNYQPSYAHGPLMDSKGGNPFKMSDALATAMTAGVAAAAPVSQSSGSSGGFSSGSSGGGGFSGGGGGGGGGGGW